METFVKYLENKIICEKIATFLVENEIDSFEFCKSYAEIILELFDHNNLNEDTINDALFGEGPIFTGLRAGLNAAPGAAAVNAFPGQFGTAMKNLGGSMMRGAKQAWGTMKQAYTTAKNQKVIQDANRNVKQLMLTLQQAGLDYNQLLQATTPLIKLINGASTESTPAGIVPEPAAPAAPAPAP